MSNRRPIGATNPCNAAVDDDLTRLARTLARQAAWEAFNTLRATATPGTPESPGAARACHDPTKQQEAG